MLEFNFNGIWELDYSFMAFEGLLSNKSTKQNKGEVKLIIEDELNEDPDPKESQIKAIQFITENSDKIRTALLARLPEYYGDLKINYGIEPANPQFPDINSSEKFAKHFGISIVNILSAEKDNYAYYGLEGGCTWDEEHGIGFLMHKDRIVGIGRADILFDSWEPYRDNGTYDVEKARREKFKKRKPVLYEPHPKYGTLKPKQIIENSMYGNRLIERGFNEEFKELVQNGKIDINQKSYLSMSLLARAIQFNNLEIGQYIFALNPKDKTGVIHKARSAQMVDLCLANGIDINEEGSFNNTLYSMVKQTLRGYRSQLKFAKVKDPSKVNELEKFLKYVASKGGRE